MAFVFISHDVVTVTIGATWTKRTFSFHKSCLSCLIASMKCGHSISQTVPHISIIATSLHSDNFLILSFISFVTCGITWTVFPR